MPRPDTGGPRLPPPTPATTSSTGPREGRRFHGASYSFTATADRTLVAHFALDTLPDRGRRPRHWTATVTGAGTYDHGDTVNMTATPATGYHFVNWTEEGERMVSTSAAYSFTATADRTLVAHFAINTYTITASAGRGRGHQPLRSGDRQLRGVPDLHHHPGRGAT